MEDLKKYLRVDEGKLEKSLKDSDRLGKLKFISADMEYWKRMFTYSGDRTPLENFLLYRTGGEFNIYQNGYDDADITNVALEELRNRLSLIQCVEDVVIGKSIEKNEKERAFLISLTNGKEIYLESDTANSLMGDLGNYLRLVIPMLDDISGENNWADATYIKEYGLSRDASDKYYKPFRNFYFYTLISRIPNELNDANAILGYREFEKRAKLVHTVQNMILVPYGYNSKRGYGLKTYGTNVKISDRMDLTIADYREMLADETFDDDLLQKRLGNNKCTKDSVAFLVENLEVLYPSIPVYNNVAEVRNIEGLTERCKLINRSLQYADYDPDSSRYTWEVCFKEIYNSSQWDFLKIFDFNELKDVKNGSLIRRVATSKYSSDNKKFNDWVGEIQIAGDTDFNFKSGCERNRKFEFFEKLILDDNLYTDEEKKYYVEKLKWCRNMHHSLENFSLMIVTGGLNNVKGALPQDRIDRFIYLLADYYNSKKEIGVNHKVFSKAVARNKDSQLRERNTRKVQTIVQYYLDSFDDIYDYCLKVYKIGDKQLVNDLIESGSKIFTNGQDVVKYMELAERYWELKANLLKS